MSQKDSLITLEEFRFHVSGNMVCIAPVNGRRPFRWEGGYRAVSLLLLQRDS